MNISNETVAQLKSMFTVSFYDQYTNEVAPELATEIYIGYEKINGSVTDANGYFYNAIHKTIKAGKKEITVDWVLSKVNADKTFKNFCDTFNKLINGKGLNAYPTSYGIGVFVAVGYRNSIQETKQKIEALINDLGIKYSTEYSEAGWVFRYKISRSQSNILKIA